MSRPWIVLPLSLLSFMVACGDKEAEDTDDGGGGGLNAGIDLDGDGYTSDVDCNDNLAIINPGATELCNSVDDDCDGEIDEGVTTTFYGDDDGDGFGDEDDAIDLCNQQPGQVTQGGDCRDDDATVNPTATEVCDGIDNNCDGNTDEDLIFDLYDDADGDGYGITSTSSRGCLTAGKATEGGDCDDADPTRYPDAPEYCGDGIVNACGGDVAAAEADCTGDLTGNDIALELGTTFTGQSFGEGAGFAVANAGDVDGDGADEILIGSPGLGTAYLIAAETAGGTAASAAMAAFTAESGGDLVGYRLSGAGDVDDDGYDDMLLSAFNATVTDGGEGVAYLVRGPVLGSMSLSAANVRLLGENPGAALGYSMSAPGDLNGDGLDDVIFAAYNDSTEAVNAGAVYLLYGPVSDGSRSVGSAADAAIYSETASVYAGHGLAGGDLNGDGVGDLAISVPYITAPSGVGYEGAIHILYGPIAGGASVLEDASDAILYGLAYQDFVGTSMGMGDFNDDGLDDLLTVAINPADYGGRADIIYGGTALAATQSLDDVVGGRITPLGTAVYVESFFSEILGDINADGRDDFILGAPYMSYGAVTNGSAYVFHGPVSGTETTRAAALRIRGTAGGDQAGASIAGAGDFDGDGRSDVLVGAPGAQGTGAGVIISFIGSGDY